VFENSIKSKSKNDRINELFVRNIPNLFWVNEHLVRKQPVI
jgi:hypothetical protein